MSDRHTAFSRLTLEETAARLRGGLDTLVLFHAHPDADAVGSGFAMRLILEAMGCRVCCACQDELPERLRFLVSDMQESVQYHSLPQDFSPRQIITVDTASPAQVGDQYARYAGRIDLMIDHHEKGEMYADGWIRGGCAATGEMIYELSRELLRTGQLREIPRGVDRLLYAAISADTGCFRYSNVTPATHRCAAELLRSAGGEDFDPADINHRLFEVKSEKLLLAEKLGFDRMRLFADGRVAIVGFPMSLKREHGLGDEHLETLVDVARSLEGVLVAVAIRQPTDADVYRVSMRSSCPLDVSAVCAGFGGGGHVRAAGCTIVSDGGMQSVMETVATAVAEALAEMGK